MTNAEAWFSISVRPQKPEGSLGRTAQDGHLDSHTDPELCGLGDRGVCFEPETLHYRDCQLAAGRNGVASRTGYNQTGKRNFRSVPCSDRL